MNRYIQCNTSRTHIKPQHNRHTNSMSMAFQRPYNYPTMYTISRSCWNLLNRSQTNRFDWNPFNPCQQNHRSGQIVYQQTRIHIHCVCPVAAMIYQNFARKRFLTKPFHHVARIVSQYHRQGLIDSVGKPVTLNCLLLSKASNARLSQVTSRCRLAELNLLPRSQTIMERRYERRLRASRVDKKKNFVGKVLVTTFLSLPAPRSLHSSQILPALTYLAYDVGRCSCCHRHHRCPPWHGSARPSSCPICASPAGG